MRVYLRQNRKGESFVRSTLVECIPNLVAALFFGFLGAVSALYMTIESNFYVSIVIGWFSSSVWLACALIFLNRCVPRRLIISPKTLSVRLTAGPLREYPRQVLPYSAVNGIQVGQSGKNTFDVRIVINGAFWEVPCARCTTLEEAQDFAEKLAHDLSLPSLAVKVQLTPIKPSVPMSNDRSKNRVAVVALGLAVLISVVLSTSSAVAISTTFVADLSVHNYVGAQMLCSPLGGGIPVSEVKQYHDQVAPNGILTAVPIGYRLTQEMNSDVYGDAVPYVKVTFLNLASGTPFTVGLMRGQGVNLVWQVIRVYRN